MSMSNRRSDVDMIPGTSTTSLTPNNNESSLASGTNTSSHTDTATTTVRGRLGVSPAPISSNTTTSASSTLFLNSTMNSHTRINDHNNSTQQQNSPMEEDEDFNFSSIAAATTTTTPSAATGQQQQHQQHNDSNYAITTHDHATIVMEEDTHEDQNHSNNGNQSENGYQSQSQEEEQQQQQQQQQLTAHQERRSSIQHILQHPHLSKEQRRHSIQILMDNRRRSSFGSTFTEAAINVAAEFSSLNNNDNNKNDNRGDGNTSRRNSMIMGNENGGSNGLSKNDTSFQTLSHHKNKQSSSICNNDYDDEENGDDNSHDLKVKATMGTSKDGSISSSSITFQNLEQLNVQHPPTIAYTLDGQPRIGNTQLMLAHQPPCDHYKRNCSIISPCCGMVFGCRLCHDECEFQYMPFMKILKAEKELQRQQQQQHFNRQAMEHDSNDADKYNNVNRDAKTIAMIGNNTLQNQHCTVVPQQSRFPCSDIGSGRSNMNEQDQDDVRMEVVESANDSMHISSKGQDQPQYSTPSCFPQTSNSTHKGGTTETSAYTSTNNDNCNEDNYDNQLIEDGGGEKVSLATCITSRRSYSRRLSLNSVVSESGGDDLHHEIDRFSIEEIICRNCSTRQSSKTNRCINCGIQFGEYHCNICNLWMEDRDGVYHCDKCGICRVGGRENFKHCDTCSMCIDINVFDTHKCQAGKFMAKCPVCYEDLFSSRSACHELPCCHSIHWDCFRDLSQVDIRCPICKKTMFPEEDIEEIWRGLREDIRLQPLPPEETRVVDLVCNDCEKRDTNRRWHPLGVDCLHCKSFNTSIDFRMKGIEAYNFLQKLEKIKSNSDTNEI